MFPAGQDNGQISSSIDHISGEQVNYAYDPLKRLTAAATVGPQWGQAYTYDGFGNLTSATVTQGSGVNWTNAADPATNRILGLNFDANGNWDRGVSPTIYDQQNRLTQGQINHSGCSGVATWQYDPYNRRFLTADPCVGNSLVFYDIFGKPIDAYNCQPSAINGCAAANSPTTKNIYFGSRLVQSSGATLVTDRLGSVRANSNGGTFSYLPYGVERTTTSDTRDKFATYFRDSSAGPNQDYADQRYYNSWYGRFFSPDPLGAKAADPANPSSWNMYAYVNGDPININDPTGQYPYPSGGGEDPDIAGRRGLLIGCGGGGGGGLPCGFGDGTVCGITPCGPAWVTDPSLSGPCGDPCGGSSFLPNPGCSYSGPQPGPDPAPQPPPPQQCSVSLWDRPIPGTPGFHTYLEVDDGSGDFTVEGGPTGPGPIGYLVGVVAVAGSINAIGTTNPSNPSNTEIGPAYTGPYACRDAQTIIGATEQYNASGNWVKYNPIAGITSKRFGLILLGRFGYNSNSFTSTLVNQVGLAGYFGFSGNPLTPGWGRRVPGL